MTGRFQPAIVIWRAREMVSASGGAFSVSVVPAPSVAPRPTVTGATSWVSEPMNASSSIGTEFVGAVVVAADGSGADVHAAPHRGVTDVREMVGLAVRRDAAVLHFDEVADMHVIRQHAARAQPSIRAKLAAGTDFGRIEMAERRNAGAGSHGHVAQHRMGTHAHAVTQFDTAFEDAADVDLHIASADQFAAHVDAGRVAQRDAVGQQPFGVLALMDALQFSQLCLVIHAQRFGNALGLRADHRHAVTHGGCNHVGQVILSLRVVVRQVREPAGQPRTRHHHDSRIDLADPAFAVRRVLLFDDAHDTPRRVAYDATVTARVVQRDGQDAQLVIARRLGQPRQRLGTQQRHVAVEHHDRLVARQHRQRLHDGMAGTQLIRLQRPCDAGIRKGRADRIAAVAEHYAGM